MIFFFPINQTLVLLHVLWKNLEVTFLKMPFSINGLVQHKNWGKKNQLSDIDQLKKMIDSERQIKLS
jgi:hypothetical protein